MRVEFKIKELIFSWKNLKKSSVIFEKVEEKVSKPYKKNGYILFLQHAENHLKKIDFYL